MEPADALTLHGRAEAVSSLRDALASASSGHGRLVVISGEAGIGKSALCEVVAREARARDAVVTSGHAWELSETPPYFPVRSCLRTLGVELEHEARARPPFELWESVLSALAQASTSAMTVWIVEDLHAADLHTLDLLALLARPIRALRVLIAVSVRSPDPRLGERGSQRVARMRRDGVDLVLGPLGDEDVAALARQCARRKLPLAVVAKLVERTGGNPLFVTECARAFGASRSSDDAATTLPSTLREAILERVALLPEASRTTLAAAAIVGRELTAALVARMIDSVPARVADDLAPALRTGLIDEIERGRFAFRHVLFRDALEASMSAETRVALHARAERALAMEGDTPDRLVERARHALSGATPDDAPRALAQATAAAEALERQGAFDAAYAMHVRIEQVRRAGLLPSAAPDERLDLARLAREAGCHVDALRICDEVATHARATGDAALLGRAAWARGSELRPGVVDGSLVSLLEEALSASRDEGSALHCRLLARLAAAKQPAPDGMVPVAMARDAIARATRVGDDTLMLDVLFFAGAAMVDEAPLEERLAVSQELLDRAHRAQDAVKSLRALARLAVDRVEVGDFAGFDEDVTRMLDIATSAGHARHRWRPLLFASMRAQMYGLFDASERLLMEAAELAGLTDDPALGLSLAAHRMRRARSMHRDQETLAALREYGDAMHGVPRSEMVVGAMRLGALARMRDRDAVAAELERWRPQDEALWQRGFHAWLAEAYALAGDERQRRRARAYFAPTVDRSIVVSHVAMTYEGPTSWLVGLLDASLGDHVAAERALRAAMLDARARGHRPWVAQLGFDLATVLLESGRRSEARELFADVATLASELAMDGLAHRARERTPSQAVRKNVLDTVAQPRLRLACQGDVWRVEHDGRELSVRDSRGMRLLARLIERPDEEIHVLTLVSDLGQALTESNAGETIDERARREYGRRLAEIGEELAAAEADADLGRAAKLAHDRDLLEQELSRAFGLGGRARKAGSATERARVNVQRRVRDALARISQVAPELGGYLARAVRTGTYCCFRP